MLKTSILKISAFALLVSFCAPMGLRAEATIENASQLTSFSASSAHSMSSDTHSDIEAVSVLSDAELKETQGAFAPWVASVGWGAVGGGINYTVSYSGTPAFTYSGLGKAIVIGGVGGLAGWSPGASAVIGGAVSGLATRYW